MTPGRVGIGGDLLAQLVLRAGPALVVGPVDCQTAVSLLGFRRTCFQEGVDEGHEHRPLVAVSTPARRLVRYPARSSGATPLKEGTGLGSIGFTMVVKLCSNCL